jgi:beta-glucosidase/6-phospho-beta-glucosidase/beta-galactosidase
MNKLLSIFIVLSLVSTNLAANNKIAADFTKNGEFFFGLATAPAHSEDNLFDSWLDFANSGGVAAFHNQAIPEERLQFYSNPEVELDLSFNCEDLGTNPCLPNVQDFDALFHYIEIAKKIRARGMKIMLTLFHHSLPKWAIEMGGWKNEKMAGYFYAFSMTVMREFKEYVDYWITFNEPSTFIMLSYVAGMWPTDSFSPIGLMGHHGVFNTALRNMTKSHKLIYNYAKNHITLKPIGIANLVAKHTSGGGVLNDISTAVMRNKLNYAFTDEIANYMDFHGVNYYAEEIVTGGSVAINPEREYSESGRAINPDGFLENLRILHKRYNVEFKGRDGYNREIIPFIITENGISDATDILRPSYLIEHLMAINTARNEGIPINGYIFWTISDNWEWADGYCPKFGMVSVDRENNLKRTLRPSYHLFRKIAKRKVITTKQRELAWKLVRDNVGELRPFCRSKDGKSSLDEPIDRPIVDQDWRFNQGN